MQADSMKAAKDQRGYKNVFDALIRVAKEEGLLKLYRYYTYMYMYMNIYMCIDIHVIVSNP
jgi:hypothetical protein